MRALKSQSHFDLIYFQILHKFLFSYDYFRILKLCAIEIGAHLEEKTLNIYVSLILVLFTFQSVLFVAMEIVAIR